MRVLFRKRNKLDALGVEGFAELICVEMKQHNPVVR